VPRLWKGSTTVKVGFDLDGTLDKPSLSLLAQALLNAGHEVHIITSHFKEGGDWQSPASKREKLARLSLRASVDLQPGWCQLHILDAVDASFPLEYRLRDLGLRKGEMCERLGISVFFDDSPTFCDVFRLMNGATTMLQVR